MNDVRVITSKVLDNANDKIDSLMDDLNNLEDQVEEEGYLVNVQDREVNNLNSLIDYYVDLKNNIDQLNFYKFVLFILKDEDDTKKFFQELKNLSLLKETGLYEYAKEQETYSRKVLNDFLLKLEKLEEDTNSSIVNREIVNIENKLDSIKEYKNYFAPIGIAKEVKNANKYNDFLTIINLSDQEKTKALLMALNFNVLLHEEKLSKYDFDNEKDTEKEPEIIEKVEIDSEQLAEEERLKKATKAVKENKDKDPYDLFVNYYDILLGSSEEDLNVLNTAHDFLKKNKKSISNLNPIARKDLEDTLNIYMQDESLREVVYSTTENIKRLCAFEIDTILQNEEKENVVERLKKVVSYINTNLSNKSKEK